ncbi:MAG: DUF1844 domain-containing protein [Terriglobales bacterium]
MPDQENPEPSIVISDRRHFTASGERRPDVPDEDRDTAAAIEIGAAAKSAAPTAKAAAPGGKGAASAAKAAAPPSTKAAAGKKTSGAIPFPTSAQPEPAAEEPPPAETGPEEVTPFVALLESLYASAMIQLGAPAPGEISRPEPDFPAARQTIEIMGVLQNKTRGNLTPGEARALEEMLYELRLYYVQLTRARGQK